MAFVEHISLRVAWHDSGWNGSVCRDPIGNASCILLKNVGPNRDDAVEQSIAGQPMLDPSRKYIPPCVGERATFMSPQEFSVIKEHPFRYNKALKGVKPTRVSLPAYSAHATPYRWMLREEVRVATSDREDIYRPELEERVDRAMGWKQGDWVMHADNQAALFEEFFRNVTPKESLAFFYAKHSPLADDPQRVLVGAARVTDVDLPRLYDTEGDPAFPSLLWETGVRHSLRPTMEDGVLLPYQDLLAAADHDPSLDLSTFVAHAPAEAWTSFSFVTEHVSHDIAIDALLVLEQSARGIASVVGGIPQSSFQWIDDQINRLWELRGPCPGLGAALSAFGIDRGTLLAHSLASHISEGSDPWPVVEKAFAKPDEFGPEVARHVTPTQCKKWSRLDEERKSLLRLLSRFALTREQAERWYRDPQDRADRELTDSALLENPYLLYEEDHSSAEPISQPTIDRGVLPPEPIASEHPLVVPSAMVDNLDPRRVRAMIVNVLEEAAALGNTLLPEVDVVGTVRALPLSQPCPLDTDTLDALDLSARALKDLNDGPLAEARLASGAPALQLRRLKGVGALIRSAITQRALAPRHADCPDFEPTLNAELGPLPTNEELAALEIRARTEKLAALRELYESRVSVLIGSAGTGKTTLLRILCSEPSVEKRGVLLLAPTGKARVRLTTLVKQPGYTIGQFLVPTRYDGETGQYRVTGDLTTRTKAYKTVVIDEASMLTEEQLAATLDALAGVERLVLVGDHRQLPPIGAGRPYVDMVKRFEPPNPASIFPRVAPCYAELTVQRRQEGAERADLQLAAWFGAGANEPDADEVWHQLLSGIDTPTLRAVRWNRATLQKDLASLLSEELAISEDEPGAFEHSYGGEKGADGRVWFNWRSDGSGSGSRVEAWQLLSPTRGRAWGTTELNRHMKKRFRSHALQAASRPPWERWFAAPIGPEQIVYGDKVINVRNRNRISEKRVYPKAGALRYVANGEIGAVVGQTKGRMKVPPWKAEVEFSSQPGFKYDYFDWSEGDALIELAWAITVHKAQGSEFELVVLVLPDTVGSLSRELLYTALTRQRRRVIIFHEGDLSALMSAAAPGNSETAKRLTNLFKAPAPIEVAGDRLDDNLIHRTVSGILVKSKNEVIIGNLLTDLGVDWTYEEPLTGSDGRVVRPDFTIRTDAGMTFYWEHLGMLDNPGYLRKWEIKRTWYQENGVTALEEGPGPRGTLMTTDDREGADSQAWAKLARTVLT